MSDKPPLRDVLSYYGVDLNSMKREQLSKCPVHDEDRPSCSVNEEDGLWNCHACNASGDAFTLIMMKEGFDEFRAALDFAEAHFGWSREGIQRPARNGRGGSGLPRGKGPGFKPSYRNSPLRGRPLSSS